MPYIKRDESGNIVAVSQSAQPGFEEEMSSDHSEVSDFLSSLQSANATLDATDQDFPINPRLGVSGNTCPAVALYVTA